MVDTLFQQNALLIAVTALLFSVGAIILGTLLLLRQSRLLTRYQILLNGESPRDLEALLIDQAQQLDQLRLMVSTISTRIATLETEAKMHLQKSATIRFNAFPDTGSDLSFAIALLDGYENGLVLSSLYGRSESRIYAKPIHGGKSSYVLSDEEREALAKASGRTQ